MINLYHPQPKFTTMLGLTSPEAERIGASYQKTVQVKSQGLKGPSLNCQPTASSKMWSAKSANELIVFVLLVLS